MIFRCPQSTPPLFSSLLRNSSHPTHPRPPSATLPFGGAGGAFNIYHVRGPFIRDLNLTLHHATSRYIVEGDEVPFEAIINLEDMKQVGESMD